MPDNVPGEGELTILGRRATHCRHRWGIVSWYIVRVLITEFGTERNRTPYPKVKPYKMLCVSCFASRALVLQVIHELIADAERAMVMIELMLKVIDDSVRRCEAMGCKRVTLRAVGARDQSRPGNFACILAERLEFEP